MTVGQLIKKLQQFDPDMPVVLKDSGVNAVSSDYVELLPQSLKSMEAKPLFTNAVVIGRQVYDINANPVEKTTKVLSLSGNPWRR